MSIVDWAEKVMRVVDCTRVTIQELDGVTPSQICDLVSTSHTGMVVLVEDNPNSIEGQAKCVTLYTQPILETVLALFGLKGWETIYQAGALVVRIPEPHGRSAREVGTLVANTLTSNNVKVTEEYLYCHFPHFP